MDAATVNRTSWSDLAQGVLLRGADAYFERQTIKYQPNDPTPNIQTQDGTASLAGQPVSNFVSLVQANWPVLAIGAAIVVAVVMIARR